MPRLLRLQRDGKRQDIGLGSAKLVSLAEARMRASELRKVAKVDKRDVRHFMELHGGTVAMTSVEEAGSVVTLTLPAARL